MTPAAPLLRIEDLRVHFQTDEGVVKAVDGVSFDVAPGEMVGIVGESGSGKSVANLTILGLTRAANAEISGRITFEGRDLLELDDEGLREVRGSQISMIFQDPLSSLHPFYKVGNQLVEAIQVHQAIDDDAAMARAIELLGLVGIPDAGRRAGEYPHEFSGGMRQRAMIAMALTNDPKLLIADEPTTALDVTTQAQILRLIERLRDEFNMAVIMITHDLGVIAEVAERVMVMYAGRIVESGTLEQIFYDPQHPYAWGLLGSLTRIDKPRTARLAQIAGQPPSLIALPEGCSFRPRCPHAFNRCTQLPPLEERIPERGHTDRCWLPPEQKKTLRVVSSGEIGLEEPAA
jgi:peptide/nickel transport system ATP-binding protein